MLVLSRRVGEQIVLPECGVTVEIVKVSGKRVRLGIRAPSGTIVHRSEIWRKICGENDDGRPEVGEDEHADAAFGDEADGDSGSEGSPSDFDAMLVEWITRRTGGRVHALSVATVGNRLVVTGSTGTYHVRQLAQAAVSELLAKSNGSAPSEVHVDIGVLAAP